MKNVFIVINAILSSYLTISYVLLEFNVTQWNSEIRFISVLLSVLWFFIIIAIIETIKDD